MVKSGARFGVALVLVAVGAGGFAIAFRGALALVMSEVFDQRDVVAMMRAASVPTRVLLPAFGGLVAGLIGIVVARAPAGHGVGDVMEAVALGRIRLSIRITLLKCAASWAAIVTGGSLGREGPLIQFGGALGKTVAERFRLPPDTARVLIAAGTAAGFGAAYNTPFAAVLFVLEVVTGVVVLDAILPAIIATVIAVMMARATIGVGPIYGQRDFAMGSSLELVAFAALGVVTALAAQLFMRLLTSLERVFRHRVLPLPWRSALGGLIAGSVIAGIPEVAGNGYEPLNALLDALLDARLAVAFVVLLFIGKCVATAASVSSGSPGGVFTPTLLIGGTIGFLFASALASLGFPIEAPGGYALVGMAATTAATTHAPLLAAVMAFELSGDYAIVLPLVLATAVATLVSRALRRDSIYTAELQERGVGWEMTMEGRKLGG